MMAPWQIRVLGGLAVFTASLACGCGSRKEPPPTVPPFRGERKEWVHLLARDREVIDKTMGGLGGTWLVIIHSTGSAGASVPALDDYHRRVKGDPLGLPYHFLIGNGRGVADGRIHFSADRLAALGSATGTGRGDGSVRLDIGLVGDANRTAPTAAQLAALGEILDYLKAKGGRLRVRLHNEAEPSPSGCPGSQFPVKELREAFPD